MKPAHLLVRTLLLVSCAVTVGSARVCAQPFDILTFDPTAPGPWSDVPLTTLRVPKVPNGSVNLDANPGGAEYGNFTGVTVTPGENAWILDYPADRVWDGPADSGFTYWLAHDDNYFYVGVDVKDDVINTDDPNAAFWKDDSIEIIVDALNDRFDVNTDSSNDAYGGHCYVNYEGRFSRWDDDTGTINGLTWSSAVAWKYGAEDDIYGVGAKGAAGWKLEVRFKKSLFEDPVAGNKLENGYVMGFNIGLDDDDQQGPGLNGNASRSEDLEIQYFWANRERNQGLTPEAWAGLTPEEQADQDYLNGLFPLIINSTGRLTHGGSGEIIFEAGSARTYGLGLNFGADEANGNKAGTLAATDKAGVTAVAQANWNNLSLLNGTNTTVVGDAAGASQPTAATVTWTSANTWSSTGRGEENNLFTGADKTLMTGYLDTGAATTTTVTIQNLPAQLTTGGYDVYVYLLGGIANKGGGYRIVDATSGAVLKDYVKAQAAVNPTAHVQAVPTATAPGTGTYVLFSGLASANIRVEATTAGGWGFAAAGAGDPRAPINAIQLVAPPSSPPPPSLSATRTATGLTITFTGKLQSADNVAGPYGDVAGATSPASIQTTGPGKFYRSVK